MTMATRWYSVGVRPGDSTQTVRILGWSRDRERAAARPGTVEAYPAARRRGAAAKARRARGFDIDWRAYDLRGRKFTSGPAPGA